MKVSYFTNFVAVVLALAAAGCGRNDVKVYQVETNETTAVPSSAPAPVSTPMAGMNGDIPAPDHSGLPQLKYTLPSGWKEKELTQLRVASFEVVENGKTAEVSVIPLSGADRKSVV